MGGAARRTEPLHLTTNAQADAAVPSITGGTGAASGVIGEPVSGRFLPRRP